MAGWYKEALITNLVDIEELEDLDEAIGQKIVDAVEEGHDYDSETWGQLPVHLTYVDFAATNTINYLICKYCEALRA